MVKITGEVATCDELNLWECYRCGVHQWPSRALEAQVSHRETEQQWAPVISYKGTFYWTMNRICNEHLKGSPWYNAMSLSIWNLKGSPRYNAYEKDIVVVNLFFGKPTVFGNFPKMKTHKNLWKNLYFHSSEFERSPKMTWLDFISSFGGICGLCLGISFVSVTEILYWFSLRLCRKKTNKYL